MTKQTQEQAIGAVIDLSSGQHVSPRKLDIIELWYKLSEKYHSLYIGIIQEDEEFFKRIHEKPKELGQRSYTMWLADQGYFKILGTQNEKLEKLRESPLGRIVSNEPSEIFDTSDHDNMLNAKDSTFSEDSDPVLSTVLNDGVYKLNVPRNTRRERKKARHRADIYGRRLQKHVYERYLSGAVGKPITIEEYEREYGFLSDKSETK